MDNGKTRLILDEDTDSTYQIQRYEPGCVWINQKPYTQSVLLGPEALTTEFNHTQVTTLKLADFQTVIDNKIDILLLGTGDTLVMPDQALIEALLTQGIGVECMVNRAACYTYTALASENRRVMACLILPQ